MPTIVEEEPSHEIYSSLFEGTASQLSSKQAASPTLLLQNESNLATISDDHQLPKNVILPDNSTSNKNPLLKVYNNNVVIPPTDGPMATRSANLSIDSSNKGYQMLSKMGWNEKDGGLGRRRQGRMNPVTSVLKKDKAGLGSPPPSMKKNTTVHKQLKMNKKSMETKAMRRRRKKEEIEKQKKKEKQVRIMLRSDIPDNMEDLFLKLC